MKNYKMILTSFALALSFGLTGCAAGNDDSHAPMVAQPGIESASPSPSPSPTETVDPNKPIVPPVKGVVSDGLGSYQQTTFDENDPQWTITPDWVSQEVEDRFTDEEVQQAYRIATKFVAEEGLDSILRAPGAIDNEALVAQWVEANRSKFADGTKFSVTNIVGGYVFSPATNLFLDKDVAYAHKYDKEQRIVSRAFTQNQAEVPDSTDIKNRDTGEYLNTITDPKKTIAFSNIVKYDMAVTENGKDQIVENTHRFRIIMENVGGEWKIVKGTMSTYGKGHYRLPGGDRTPVQ